MNIFDKWIEITRFPCFLLFFMLARRWRGIEPIMSADLLAWTCVGWVAGGTAVAWLAAGGPRKAWHYVKNWHPSW